MPASKPLPSNEELVDPYHELFERSADAILIIEGDTFVDCNRATMDMLGYATKAELLQTHPSALSPPRQPDGRDSREKANEMIAIAFREGNHRFEWAHLRADGVVIPVEVLLTAVQRGARRILHVVWRDLTEQKALADQLRHAQKMEAIGKLSGGIAHDFNNLLVAILCNCELLLEHLDGEPRQFANEIMAAGERASGLVQQLLTFGRKQEVKPEVVDVCEVCSHLQSLLERLIGEDVQLETMTTGEPVKVKIDPGQLEQVVVNLVTNARDALPSGGAITVQVQSIELDGAMSGPFGELESGPYALLSVTDNGVGMSGETAQRAFDPFFTTKKIGEGTGLGLATVYGITTQAEGAAAIYSAVGEGTSVKVALPLARESGRTAVLRHDLPTEGGDETILVVEDDPAVSALISRVLSAKGYRLLQASNGEEGLAAWAACERAGDKIDLVFTDVVMPVAGGVELVHHLHERGLSPRVLFASGYTNNAFARLREVGDDIDLLEKPFTAAQLIGRVRLALDRSVT